MYDHVGFKVKDVDASARFYAAALGALGYEQGFSDESTVSFGPRAPALWVYGDERLAHSLLHVALSARAVRPSMPFIAPGSRPAGATTAHRDCGAITARPTTRRSCWTPTATTRGGLPEVGAARLTGPRPPQGYSAPCRSPASRRFLVVAHFITEWADG